MTESSQSSELSWPQKADRLSLSVRDFVDGRLQTRAPSQVLEKFSPRDGRLLYQTPIGGAVDVDLAVASARAAFADGRWARKSAQQRRDVLLKLVGLMHQHRDELALLECLDVGKPISDTLNIDLPMAIDAIQYSGEAADKLCGKVYGADSGSLSYELRRPSGVVAGVVGWNFPLVLATSKIGPVLATGNSLVLKPSELTSLSALRVAQLAVEAGLPEGVLNVVHGDGAVGSALAHHGDVDLLTFTGSSQTGKALLVASGRSNMKKLILECGGKAPNIVFDDCPDLEAIAGAIVNQMFWNQGQVCTASSRLLIHNKIKDELLSILIDRSRALGMGDPLDPQTTLGAVVSQGHRQRIMGYIERGKTRGARVAYESKAEYPFPNGSYVPPVIFDEVSIDQVIAQEEIFGPVVSVMGFDDETDAIRIANSTIYGLSAILWTRDISRAHRVTQGISAGWIVVNATGAPHGGAPGLTIGGQKQSGIGFEGGLAGLEAYMTSTAVQYFVDG